MLCNIANPTALFDMDGSLCDYDGAMIRDLNKLRWIDSLTFESEPEITNLRTMEHSSYIKERMDLIKRQPGWWENLEPLDLGMSIYKILESLHFRIHILTQGPAKTTSAWSEKVRWCNNHLNTTDITITRDKGLVYGKILVDDFPDYAFRWLEYRPRGLVIMPENSQNKNIKHPSILVCNIKNLDEVRFKCKEIADKFFTGKDLD